MARTKYDRVYSWDKRTEEWEGHEAFDTEHACAIRDNLLDQGLPAHLGKASIGPPEGPPDANIVSHAEKRAAAVKAREEEALADQFGHGGEYYS